MEDIETIHKIHDSTLKETKSFVNSLLWCIFLRGLSIYIGDSIWVLFARDFLNDSSIISIVLYVNYVIFAFSSLILGSISELLGYDFTLILCYVVGMCGLLLEVIAPYFNDNDENDTGFIILSIGFLMYATMPGKSIVLAFIAWILPLYNSKEYTVMLYQLKTVLFVITPIIAGVVSYYWSYQGVFVIAFVISVFLTIYVFAYVNKQQKYFENLQKSNLLNYYRVYTDSANSDNNNNNNNNNNDIYDENWINSSNYRFPSLAARLKKDVTKDETNDESNDRSNDRSNDESFCSKFMKHFSTKWDYLSKHEWYLLFTVLFQNCMGMGIQVCVIYYYAPYMKDLYDVNIVISTSQIALFCMGNVIGEQIIKYFFQNENINSNYLGGIAVLSYIIGLVFNVLIYPNLPYKIDNADSYMVIFYVIALVYGLVIGVLIMITELRLLELQPKEIAGRIVGIRGFFRALAEGTMVLLVGQLWDFDEYYVWFWYIQAISCAIGIACVVNMFFVTKRMQTVQYSSM